MSQQEDRAKESGNQMLLDIESRIAKGVNEAREDLQAVTKHEKRVMELHQNENEDKTALLNEISRQKTMIEALQRTFEEELKATVSERTKQNIRDIKAADNSMGLTGFINTDKEEAKVDQNISQIYTDGDSVSVTGMAKNIDIVAMLSLMKSSKK
ncbi:hypothetical protein FPSE5266_02802 [Fusarium pseudograminearum]|nr:hypothetical protein FPSE5266_02802 [Fusarium pseudograminearum]